ncbi:acyltransferase family protein [Leifsonia aquatica]|uniref:acyltransferase family protein n=1 Tax=Leifsonia aquatica TaxID=144185 RepID=UPI0028B1480E|nr:acyltransferase family protein [Leifsonia aquatica]
MSTAADRTRTTRAGRRQAATSPRGRTAVRRGHREARAVAPLPLVSSYFPAIDGLRAIAILSVLLFHTGLYSNGLFGVDMFFALSGFLITLTMLREFHRTGGIHLGRFYLRRAKRLLPLLFVVLALTLWGVAVLGTRAELERFGQQAVASLVYLTNWEQIAAGQGYWDGFGAINPLGHMWSLAITEQFYLVWPLVMFLVLALGKRLSRGSGPHAWQWSRRSAVIVLVVGIAGLAVAGAMPMLRFDGSNWDRLYLGTDTHIAGLVAGSVAATINYLWLQRASVLSARAPRRLLSGSRASVALRRVVVTSVSVAALTAIVVLSLNATTYEEPWLYRWGFLAIALIGSLLILTLTSPHNVLSRVFAWKPLVEIGKVSYTLFLVHMPIYWLILALAPYSTPWDLVILGLPASLLLAGGLHHLVAEPIRLRRWRITGTAAFSTLVAGVTAAVLIVPGILLAAPVGAGSVKVLTLGDSLANDFASALGTYEGDRFTVIDGGLPGCGISGSTAQRTRAGITQSAPATCNPWESRWTELIDESTPDYAIVNIAWDAVTQQIDGEWTDLTDPAFAKAYRDSLDTLAEVTSRPGLTVLVANSRLHNGVISPEQAMAFNAILDDFFADHPEIVKLDLQDEVCTVDECATMAGDERMYLDDRVHFSAAGKQLIAPWLAEQIGAATSAAGTQGGAGTRRH